MVSWEAGAQASPHCPLPREPLEGQGPWAMISQSFRSGGARRTQAMGYPDSIGCIHPPGWMAPSTGQCASGLDHKEPGHKVGLALPFPLTTSPPASGPHQPLVKLSMALLGRGLTPGDGHIQGLWATGTGLYHKEIHGLRREPEPAPILFPTEGINIYIHGQKPQELLKTSQLSRGHGAEGASQSVTVAL